MKKREQAMKHCNTSDYDEHFEEDEEKEDTGNSSAESVEEENSFIIGNSTLSI